MTLRHERTERHTIAIRKGDNVRVIAGKDAGKSGRVLSIDAKKNRVVVEHVAIMKRHTTAQSAEKHQGRHRRKRGVHQRFQCDGGMRQLRQAHAHRPHGFAGRQQGP